MTIDKPMVNLSKNGLGLSRIIALCSCRHEMVKDADKWYVRYGVEGQKTNKTPPVPYRLACAVRGTMIARMALEMIGHPNDKVEISNAKYKSVRDAVLAALPDSALRDLV